MRIISLLVVFLSLSIAWTQEAKKDDPSQEQAKILAAMVGSEAVVKQWPANAPSTLAEAHAALEQMLSPQTLAEIDAMPSEYNMIKYHFGLGTGIRNNWGLWRGGPLGKHMRELGFVHPDDMSGVILNTFWCKRHGQDFCLKERAAASKKSMEAAQKAQQEEENRFQKAKAAMRNMMMGLQFEQRNVPSMRMPDLTGRRLRARFLSPFRGGVFIAAYRRTGKKDYLLIPATSGGKVYKPTQMNNAFVTPGYYYDPTDHKVHKIRVGEVNDVCSAVVVGHRAWFAGTTDEKAVLVGVNGEDRIVLPLPQDGEPPQLGIDDQSLLAVFPKTIFRLTDQKWTLIHSGDFLLPHSGPPPQRHGNAIFFRDEGREENCKRLWWLTLGDERHLTSLDGDTGLVGPYGPRWENSFSYCVTDTGDLWACVGEGYARKSLLRRSKDGTYSIAIMNNSVQFTEDLFGSAKTDQGLSVSAVAALENGTILLVSEDGLYRLKGNELMQELAFTYAQNEAPAGVPRGRWDPSQMVVLDEHSYVIGTTFGGVYLLRKGNDGQWSCLPLDAEMGDPVVW